MKNNEPSSFAFLPSIELVIEEGPGPEPKPVQNPVKVANSEKGDAERLYAEAHAKLNSGEAAAAEQILKQVLAIVEKRLGTHASVADVLVNLSIACTKQGKYAAAKLHAHRAISIFEALKGKELDIARTLNNMAAIYTMQNMASEGEQCLKRAISVMEAGLSRKIGKPSHPCLLPILENYVHLLETTNRAGDAAPLQLKILAIKSASASALS